MHLPAIFKLSFDPDKSDLPVLKNQTGRILWMCIKSGHITSQHFNDHVLSVANRIEKEAPQDYYAFEKIIKSSSLSVFGRVTVEETSLFHHDKMDHEFWGEVWRTLKGRRRLDIEIKEA